MSSIQYELETKTFLGQQPFRCPRCDTTRLTNLVAPQCKECKTEMVLIEYDPDSKWDYNGQEIFLTWSQTPETFLPENLVNSLDRFFDGSTNSVQDYLITREPHVDEGHHIHAYIRFAKRFRTANRHFFDWKPVKDPLATEEQKPIHPNWQRVRGNKHKLFHYLKKDGEYRAEKRLGWIANFDPRPRVLQIVDDCNSWAEYYEAIAYIGSDYWKIKSTIELMRIKLEKLHGRICNYHKWVAGAENGYYVCLSCEELRHPDDIIQKGLTEKGRPRSMKEIFSRGNLE